ncbi:MAG: zinc ribbon domain-containing protein [Acidobacteriaceae bacterium]
MNPSCHRCGATLSASELFCPNCGSPQLRFAQPDENESGWAARPAGAPARAKGISWKDAILAALLVAVPVGLLSAISVLSWGCCVWVVGGAMLAIVVYHRRAPAFLLETRSGVRIGAVAGLLAAYSSVIATAIWRVFARYVLHQGNAIDQFYESVIQQSVTLVQNTPETHNYVQFLLSPDGRAAYSLMNEATTSLGIILFSAIGGALGVRLLAPRKPTMGNG